MILIGAGSGRCGTTSLSKLIDNCEGYACTHERPPVLDLQLTEENIDRLQMQLDKFSDDDFQKTVDVAWYHLPYIESYIMKFGAVKVIVLKRDKEETIESLLKTIKGKYFTDFRRRVESYFGKSNARTRRNFFDEYYDKYYVAVEILIDRHSDMIKLFDISAINDDQDSLFDWFMIPKENRRYIDKCVYNQSE